MDVKGGKITWNTFEKNKGYGLELYETEYLWIYLNGFHNNCIEIDAQSQAYESNGMNRWAGFYGYSMDLFGNYWTDWDGSKVYSIDGGLNYDSYPLEYTPEEAISRRYSSSPTSSDSADSVFLPLPLLILAVLIPLLNKYVKNRSKNDLK